MVHLLCGGLEGNLHDLTITKAKEEQKKKYFKIQTTLACDSASSNKG